MQYRTFGRTGWQVSEIGYGMWGLGGWTESDDAPMPPIRVVSMNTAAGVDAYERRESPLGHTYYWAAGSGMQFRHTAPESDVEALFQGCVTVTPLNFDLTDHARMSTWRERLVPTA